MSKVVPLSRLAFGSIHGHEVSRVHSISEELESKARDHLCVLRHCFSDRGSNETVLRALEDASVLLSCCICNELDSGHSSDRVDVLGPSAKPAAIHGISWSLKGRSHRLGEDASHLQHVWEVAGLGLLRYYLGPQLSLFVSGR